MRVEFSLTGLPPKKDGASSMWGKATEIPRILNLRRAAKEQMAAVGPFATEIGLELEVHTLTNLLVRSGDLDNLVTGVCDGLMAAHGRYWRNYTYPEPEWDGIQPGEVVAIQDDAHVISIVARKVADATSEPWYKVILTGEP